jgi:hypothetical protein
MNTQERSPNPAPPQPQLAGMGDGGGSDLDAVRQSAEAMLAAGDAAIARVLSSDSAKFIQQAPQQGGE